MAFMHARKKQIGPHVQQSIFGMCIRHQELNLDLKKRIQPSCFDQCWFNFLPRMLDNIQLPTRIKQPCCKGLHSSRPCAQPERSHHQLLLPLPSQLPLQRQPQIPGLRNCLRKHFLQFQTWLPNRRPLNLLIMGSINVKMQSHHPRERWWTHPVMVPKKKALSQTQTAMMLTSPLPMA